MREIEINLTLRFKIPETDLNVNGLLFGLKNVNSQIMLGITKILFKAIENDTIEKILSHDTENKYVRNGKQRERTLKTSFGDLKYSFSQLKDQEINQNIVPLREKLKIPKYRRYQNESMEPAIGLAVHLSYARSDKEIERIRGFSASRWTVWRRLHDFSNSTCQFEDMNHIPYIFLMPDGTKVHLQGPKGIDLGQKQLRWAWASTGVYQPFDIVGLWVDTSWEKIAEELKCRLDYDKIQVLISDGEPGMENLLTEGMRHQRCVFHGRRDFPYILYQDGHKKGAQKELRDILESIPAMTISNAQIEKLTQQDKSKVTELCKRTENDFHQLIRMLDPKKYPKARIYIQNLSKSVSTFFNWWLEKDEWIPFTSNIIENRFSQVKNRIKKIGRRWSGKGLLKWLMVVVKKIFTPFDWGYLWKQFLEINQPMFLHYIKISYRWTI
jgi:hypothetical protein